MEQVSAHDFHLVKDSPRVSDWNQDEFLIDIISPKAVQVMTFPLATSQELRSDNEKLSDIILGGISQTKMSRSDISSLKNEVHPSLLIEQVAQIVPL